MLSISFSFSSFFLSANSFSLSNFFCRISTSNSSKAICASTFACVPSLACFITLCSLSVCIFSSSSSIFCCDLILSKSSLIVSALIRFLSMPKVASLSACELVNSICSLIKASWLVICSDLKPSIVAKTAAFSFCASSSAIVFSWFLFLLNSACTIVTGKQ